jgi:hypothetical protein
MILNISLTIDDDASPTEIHEALMNAASQVSHQVHTVGLPHVDEVFDLSHPTARIEFFRSE